ncbi:hypothetical protein GRJ2_000433600 [Grus japonensis]|uniref:Uncharacterized protein n=1 Tax=Grus japonensis TaxID=30415 RepID=A0ABC9W3A7_GRUJA
MACPWLEVKVRWMQCEELEDQARDVAQHNKEQAVKLLKVTDSVTGDGRVSQGLRRVIGNPIRDTSCLSVDVKSPNNAAGMFEKPNACHASSEVSVNWMLDVMSTVKYQKA